MDSTPDYSAGLFEHVAKMSRISDNPPSDAESAPPPVRYLNTSQTESIFPLGGLPLVSTFIPPQSQSDKSDVDLPVKKTVPVKLCRVHPLSNQPELDANVDPPRESQPASNKVDLAGAAEQERQKNKQLHRDKEKISDPPSSERDEKKLSDNDKPNADDDKEAIDEKKPDEEHEGKHKHHEHRKHKHKKRSKSRDRSKHRERSRSRDESKDRDPSPKHDDKKDKEPEKDQGKEEELELEPVKESDEKKDTDQDKAREKKERKKQRKEEKRKAKQKKQEQEDLSKKSQEDIEDEKQYSSPSAKIMQDTRHQKWKKSPWQPSAEAPVEERKVRRNMRAAPLRRQSSETRSNSLSRRSSLKEQEFLQQLEQQRRIIAEREKLEQLAQQLINQAYLEKKASAQQQRLRDAQTASCLLSDAFSLVQPVSEIPNYVHRSAASSPVPPAPGVSDVDSATSACTEPGLRRHRMVNGGLQRKQSSLEMLYSHGALTQLPLAGLQNSNLDTTRTAWNASSCAISAASCDLGQNQGNSILSEANGQLSSLSDKQRQALLTAVQEELHRLNAFS